MRKLATFIRYIGLLAGLFLVASAIADIAGLIPHSNDMPSLGARAASNLPPLLFGTVLLLPHRWFLVSPRFYALFGAYALLIGAVGYKAAETFSLVRTGELDPAAMPVAMLALGIPALNAAALWLRRRTAT
ncbi:hypothetical protein [Lysobacter niastensis]|uniref:Uncharacterized protein n=1 Tax=Lysobacter niastensis TaxID=380629 RepID=A0ABS0B4T3_9GAMM|nr:hypothetical protein [Lysobacter niastensis]MBF6023713.1 hypothetical protein [Lysobacter niastensis]